jgi:hypothetical protein
MGIVMYPEFLILVEKVPAWAGTADDIIMMLR